MTHSGGKSHRVGDEGQQYEITYYDPNDDERKVFGWTDSEDIARKMGNNIDKHPSWQYPQVTDRHA